MHWLSMMHKHFAIRADDQVGVKQSRSAIPGLLRKIQTYHSASLLYSLSNSIDMLTISIDRLLSHPVEEVVGLCWCQKGAPDGEGGNIDLREYDKVCFGAGYAVN